MPKPKKWIKFFRWFEVYLYKSSFKYQGFSRRWRQEILKIVLQFCYFLEAGNIINNGKKAFYNKKHAIYCSLWDKYEYMYEVWFYQKHKRQFVTLERVANFPGELWRTFKCIYFWDFVNSEIIWQWGREEILADMSWAGTDYWILTELGIAWIITWWIWYWAVCFFPDTLEYGQTMGLQWFFWGAMSIGWTDKIYWNFWFGVLCEEYIWIFHIVWWNVTLVFVEAEDNPKITWNPFFMQRAIWNYKSIWWKMEKGYKTRWDEWDPKLHGDRSFDLSATTYLKWRWVQLITMIDRVLGLVKREWHFLDKKNKK